MSSQSCWIDWPVSVVGQAFDCTAQVARQDQQINVPVGPVSDIFIEQVSESRPLQNDMRDPTCMKAPGRPSQLRIQKERKCPRPQVRLFGFPELRCSGWKDTIGDGLH
jgi:hypothetical protein